MNFLKFLKKRVKPQTSIIDFVNMTKDIIGEPRSMYYASVSIFVHVGKDGKEDITYHFATQDTERKIVVSEKTLEGCLQTLKEKIQLSTQPTVVENILI